VGLERGPLSLVSTNEQLENPEYGRRDPLRRPHGTLYPKKLVGMVRSRTHTTEFSFYGITATANRESM
jgi:hypothetical protein